MEIGQSSSENFEADKSGVDSFGTNKSGADRKAGRLAPDAEADNLGPGIGPMLHFQCYRWPEKDRRLGPKICSVGAAHE